MPKIEIQQSTYDRLERHAKEGFDTPEAVILRALDALEKLAKDADRFDANEEVGSDAECLIDPHALPDFDLTHTKILDATIDGKPSLNCKWNSLVDDIVQLAMVRLGSYDSVRRCCPVTMIEGRKEDEGYRYLSEVDISIVYRDANGACRILVAAAQKLGIDLDIGFMWRDKDSAAYPGERARLTVKGRQGRGFSRMEEISALRVLDAPAKLEQPADRSDANEGVGSGAERFIDPHRALPNLSYTKVLDATFNGEPSLDCYWNCLVKDIINLSMEQLGSYESLRRICPANTVKGRKENETFRYISGIDISVQYQDANAACRTLIVMAQELGIDLDIGFMWDPKKSVGYPGERARLTVKGRKDAATGARPADTGERR